MRKRLGYIRAFWTPPAWLTADPGGVTGQCVKAFVMSDSELAAAELAAWLRDRLEEYEHPATLGANHVDSRTSSGKMQRHFFRWVPPLLPGEG